MSLSISHESLLQELRQRQHSEAGRAQLRERVAVEHSLAHIGQWLLRSASLVPEAIALVTLVHAFNLFDLRRLAVVHNLHVIARMPELTAEPTA